MVGEKTIIMWWLYKHGQRETMNPETRQASDRTTDPLTNQATTRTQTDPFSASILHIVWWLHFSFMFLMLPSVYGKNIWAFSLRFKGIPLAGSNEFSSLLQILSNGLISHCLKLSIFSHPKPVSNKGVRTSTIVYPNQGPFLQQRAVMFSGGIMSIQGRVPSEKRKAIVLSCHFLHCLS